MQEGSGILKEGFLVKKESQDRLTWASKTYTSRIAGVDPRRPIEDTETLLGGHVVHNWKARWFVLLQDKLLYYKLVGGKKEPSPKGRILLDGCTITCPCLDYESRPLVIKLRTKTNTEYFLDSCSREERDSWALDITGAIHAGNPVQVQQLHLMKNSFKLPSNISLNHIVDKMHDNRHGIKLTLNTEQGNTYKESFTGSVLVDWLISNSFAASRLEAVTLASVLMEESFVKPMGARSVDAMRNGDLAEQFLDDSTALYTFSESYKKKVSSKEELHLNILELSGTIVKQGFLIKQGHKRKNWKVRRFILRADPAFLHYYDPTKPDQLSIIRFVNIGTPLINKHLASVNVLGKGLQRHILEQKQAEEDNRPVGGFSLRGCLVSALEDNGVPAGVKGNVQGNLFKIITKNDLHYYIQASSKAERVHWIEAIKQLT